MAGKVKSIGTEDLEFIRTYVAGRILNGTFGEMLVNADREKKIRRSTEKAIEENDTDALNKWLSEEVNSEARKQMWTAARMRGRKTNRNTLSAKLVEEIKTATKKDDIESAVMALLRFYQKKTT